jgi:tetratricopeptide (TPR) repeat protein
MKKLIVTVLFLIISVPFLSAQKKVQDSIFKILKAHPLKDTIRVKLLIEASYNATYNNPKKAFNLVEEALKTASQINWIKGKSLAMRQKGVIYYSIADNLNSMEAFQQALKIGGSVNNKLFQASIYNNLANIYADMKLFDKALHNYYQLLSIAKELNNKKEQIKALTNIGIVQTETIAIDKGISNLKEALSLAKKEKNEFFIAAILNNLGLAYKRKKDYLKSLNYYSEANTLAKRIDNNYIEATTLNSIGKVHILLKNYKAAETFGVRALSISQKIDAVEWQADAWEVLSKVYENKNNNTEAFRAYKNHIKLRDSVLTESKIAELTQKEMQFKLEKQEALSSAEIKRQKLIKNTSIMGGSGLVLLSVISFMLYIRKRDSLSQKKEAEFRVKVAETELKALRAQMNPHFIFNSLNSIGDYILKNDTQSATVYLTKFAKLMRQTLENSNKKEVLLKNDIDLLKTYLDIENKRFSNSFTYNINIDTEIDAENTLVPPLILQPFIENSIIHGLALKEGKGHILIEIKKDKDMIICAVDDNGIGRLKSFETKSIKNKTSHGMKITKSRIDIINQLKKVQGYVKVIDKDKGVRVEVSLPLELTF